MTLKLGELLWTHINCTQITGKSIIEYTAKTTSTKGCPRTSAKSTGSRQEEQGGHSES